MNWNDSFSENRMVLERNLQEEQEHLYQAETELEEWKNQKDPEPERAGLCKGKPRAAKGEKNSVFPVL